MINGLHALILIVKDLKRQKAFYRDVLGLKVEADYGDAVFFECGDQKIALFDRDHHPEGTESLEGAPKGISHMEFRIPKSNRREFDARLREAGFHAYRDCYRDADGNLFHFVFE